MKYLVAEDHDIDRFIRTVNNLIKQGWKPLGGISVNTLNIYNKYYHQSMIFEDEAKPLLTPYEKDV